MIISIRINVDSSSCKVVKKMMERCLSFNCMSMDYDGDDDNDDDGESSLNLTLIPFSF